MPGDEPRAKEKTIWEKIGGLDDDRSPRNLKEFGHEFAWQSFLGLLVLLLIAITIWML